MSKSEKRETLERIKALVKMAETAPMWSKGPAIEKAMSELLALLDMIIDELDRA
jgi:hypothetical protein